MNLVTPEIIQSLGKMVLAFGSMELVIRGSILKLSQAHELTKTLLQSSNSVSININILRRLCYVKVQEEKRVSWIEALEELEYLFSKRNQIFHGMITQYEGELQLVRIKKGKREHQDSWHETSIENSDLIECLSDLDRRYRQFMDFLEDEFIFEQGPTLNKNGNLHGYPDLTIV